MSAKLHTVHVRVNDAATGQPTPCRVRFTDSEGRYYAPLGRLTDFVTDPGMDVGGNVLIHRKAHAYMDGTCEIRLPAEALTVTISKGPEYKPIEERITLAPGKLALRFELERWINLRAEGWYSGDMRCEFLTPHAALLEAAAEDVAVVNLLAKECVVHGEEQREHRAIPNILAFSGQRPVLEMPGHMVVVNTLNWHPVLGRLLLLNCHRVVYPLTFGGPAGADDWTLADWCDQCHRKGGLVVGDVFCGDSPDPDYGEVLANVILGNVDALHVFEPHVPPCFMWDDALNCGCRIPLVAGSGKDSNSKCLGSTRTYAQLRPGEEFNYKNWIEAVRAGRTFVTTGPLLSLTANGQGPGAVFSVPASGSRVRVRVEARSSHCIRQLELLWKGMPVAQVHPTSSPASAVIETEILVPEPRWEPGLGASGWLAARCVDEKDLGPGRWTAAQTSPIYFDVEGQPVRPDQENVDRFLEEIDKSLAWVAREARCDEKHRERLANIFRSARQELLKRSLI